MYGGTTMNVVVLSGRLTRDPLIKYGQDDKAIANYTLAVDYSKDLTSFINCVAYDKAAEFTEKYLKKGSRIELNGRLRTGNYTDKEGKKVYYTEVVVQSQAFGETKAEAEAHQNDSSEEAKEPQTDNDGFMNIPQAVMDDELPFA